MTQLLSIKNKQVIAKQAIQSKQMLTAQADTAFVIDQPTTQTLPQVQVNMDKTVVTLNSQESLVLDTSESAELFLHTPEQNYKLVYGQWTAVDTLPMDVVLPSPVSEAVTLHASAEEVATLSGLADSGWLWGGLGIAALGGVGFALSKGGSSGSGSSSDSSSGTSESTHQPAETVPNTNNSNTDTGTTPNPSTGFGKDIDMTVSPDMTTGGQAGHTETNSGNNNPPPISPPSNNNNNPPPVSPPNNNNNNGGSGNNNGGTGNDNNHSGNNNSGNNNNPSSNGKLGVYVPKPLTDFVANVKDYGAKGDGQTDDTAAIQKAIDAVHAKGGGIVDVPAGTYMINPLAYKGVYGVVSDDGGNGLMMRSNVTLRMADNTVLKAIPNASKGYSVITFYDVENAHVLGGTLIGDRDEHQDIVGMWGNGINVLSSKNIVLENVTSKDFWGLGFYINKNSSADAQSENIVLYDVSALNNRRQGISINDGKNIKILNSEFSDTTGHMPQSGINVEPNVSNQGSVSDVEIIGNTFKNNQGFGISLSASQYANTTLSNVRVEDNFMLGNRDGIWALGVKGGTIKNNTIYNLDITEGRTGGERQIRLDENSENITVSGNTFYGGSAIRNDGSGNTVVNNTYKAAVFIRGEAKVGETLTTRVYDGDQLGTDIRYQWYLDGQPVNGKTGASYIISNNDHGKRISVSAEFTDGKGNAENVMSAMSVPVGSVPENTPPSFIRISEHRFKNISNYPLVPENRAGYVVGKLHVDDPDAGDSHTFRVDDPRFEVKDGYLKLKDGQILDYDRGKTVPLSIEVTDRAGAKFVYSNIIVQVEDDPTYAKPNHAPTAIMLDQHSVTENRPGAIIGKLTVSDPDVGDKHSFRLSDGRFEVVDGILKLKAGQSLDYAKSKSIGLTVTALDEAGASHREVFTLQVQDDPTYPASQASAKLSAKTLALPLVENNATLFETPTASLKDSGLAQPAQYDIAPLHKDDGLGNVNNNNIL